MRLAGYEADAAPSNEDNKAATITNNRVKMPRITATPKPKSSAGEPTVSLTLPPIEENNKITSAVSSSRHRCPHHPKVTVTKGDKPCMLTEYATRYTPKQAEAVQSFKPSQEPHRNAGALASDTTNRVDYVPHEVSARFVKAPEVYQKPEGKMEDLSSYKQEYIKKSLPITKTFKPDQSRKVLGNFRGTPTYKADYRRWTPQPPERVVKDSGYRPPTAPFHGTSGYTVDYVPKSVPVRASMKPQEAAKTSDKPFEDGTSYKQEYTKKPLPEREMKERAQYVANKAPLDGISSYMKDYIAKEGAKLPSCKPDHGHYRSDAPFHDETTQRLDYQKWPAEKPFVRAAEPYVKPEGKMDGLTTTHVDYPPKPLVPQPPARPAERKGQPGRFYGDTTQKMDYKSWSPIQNNRVVRTSGYCPPDAPFQGTSNYTTDYIRHPAGMRPSMKPQEAAKKSDAPFDDSTAYKQEYTKKAMPAKEVREKPMWMPNKVKFQGHTNYADDFIPKQTERVQNFKPDASPHRADAPFHDATTQRTDYQAWQAEKPYVHVREEYQPPAGDFDDKTTHRLTFTPKAIEPVKQARPPSVRREAGRFDGHTTYKGDYIKKFVPAQRVEKKSDYRVPDAPFQGTTNYTDDFIKHQNAMRKSLRPAEAAVGSNAPFDGSTMYKTDYYKKDIQPCPAALIAVGTSTKYKFQDQDPSGHKWYQKLATPPVAALQTAAQPIQLPVA